jgi:hypothetical protein
LVAAKYTATWSGGTNCPTMMMSTLVRRLKNPSTRKIGSEMPIHLRV